MTRLSWNSPGTRVFEAGVDRGVLYVNGKGVVWNGLIGVTENPQGAAQRAFYVDGRKYLNESLPEEYSATLDAFTYPDEFEICDGTAYAGRGVYVDEQLRVPFNLCYRSLVGNDLQGADFGYRIHLVYQALAAPSSKARGTISDSVNPTTMSWNITTLPQDMRGYLPVSHSRFEEDESGTSLSFGRSSVWFCQSGAADDYAQRASRYFRDLGRLGSHS